MRNEPGARLSRLRKRIGRIERISGRAIRFAVPIQSAVDKSSRVTTHERVADWSALNGYPLPSPVSPVRMDRHPFPEPIPLSCR